MSYDFSFEKKSIILIAIGCLAIGVLLFFAGYIVGLDRGQNQSVVQASSAAAAVKSSSSKETAAAEKEKSPAEKEPPAPAEEPKKAAPEKSPEPATAKAESKSAAAPAGTKPSAAKEEDTKDKEKPAFSVQLGAFQTEDNAVKLRDNLKARGYSVFLFRVMDADGNVWHTVRTGHYADMKEAAREAVKITRKEQISAWVRPANAF